MAKAKLASLTEKWIDGNIERQHAIKAQEQKEGDSDEKIKQTLYISKRAAKMLWQNRVDTREPISHTVEKLVLKHLAGK